MTSPAELQTRQRKIRDRAAILVIAGVILLMPPFALASLADATIVGLPVTLVYVFVVWIALVAGTAVLAGPLLASDETNAPDNPGSGA